MAENNVQIPAQPIRTSKPKTARHNRRFKQQRPNNQTISTVKKELDQRLFAEYDSIPNLFDSMSVAVQKRGVSLPIATRGIGMVMTAITRRLQQQLPNIDIPTHEWYRVSLAQLDLKMHVAQQAQLLPLIHPTYGASTPTFELTQAAQSCRVNLSPLSHIINTVGNFVLNDVHYYARYSPQPELTPVYSTLRDFTARATVNANRLYSQYACIPGGEWEEAQGLVNADDIIPANYAVANLRADISTVKAFVAQVERKVPKFMGVINYVPEGTPAQLVSLNTATTRVSCSVINAVPTLAGESGDFYSLHTIPTTQQVLGIASLFGEEVEQANACVPNQCIRSNYAQSCGYNVQWEDIMNGMLS